MQNHHYDAKDSISITEEQLVSNPALKQALKDVMVAQQELQKQVEHLIKVAQQSKFKEAGSN